MAIIRECTVAQIAADPAIHEILQGYADEAAIVEFGAVKPEFGMYAMIEASGSFKAIGVFAPGLVGLLTLLIYGLPHYDGKKVASVESFYVLPAYRSGGYGLKLLHMAEQTALESGADVLMVSAPIGKRLEAILPRSGYRATNTVFTRALS